MFGRAGQFGEAGSGYDPLMKRAWCSECSPGHSSVGVDVDFCPSCGELSSPLSLPLAAFPTVLPAVIVPTARSL